MDGDIILCKTECQPNTYSLVEGGGMSCSIQQKTHLTLVTGGEGYNAMYKRIHTQNLPLAKENITFCTTEHKPNTYCWLRMILCCVRQTTNPALVIGGVAITLCTTHLWWTGISCFVQHNTNPTLIVRGGGYYAVHDRTQKQHLRSLVEGDITLFTTEHKHNAYDHW